MDDGNADSRTMAAATRRRAASRGWIMRTAMVMITRTAITATRTNITITTMLTGMSIPTATATIITTTGMRKHQPGVTPTRRSRAS